MLVWSKAWSAEGEKGKTSCSFQHTPTQGCVPAAYLPPDPTVCKWNQRNDFDRNDAFVLFRHKSHFSIAARGMFTRHRRPRRRPPKMATVARFLTVRKTFRDRTFGGYMGTSSGRTVRPNLATQLLPVSKTTA
jgi:hypothetical protein